MSLPIALTLAYLAVNVVMMVWVESRGASGEPSDDGLAGPSDRVAILSNALRYGPPLLGLFYLVTIAGDWMFFVFVAVFFAGSFWMMDGLLSTTTTKRTKRDAMHRGWDDRGRSRTDREAG
jgi:uncharacterized membrane protein YecN with MAPEG domain